MQAIDTIVHELETAIGGPAVATASVSPAQPDGGTLAMPQARFEELRAQAAATCRSLNGARVAALQIEASTWGVRGAQHIIDLLTRVVRDESHAA
jgi:hypothetical protein